MTILRGPGGCPWDLEQTHASLRKYLLEETYELADAIDAHERTGQIGPLEEELGDVYLQVLFHARIGEQTGTMSMDTVADRLVQKMIDRHPHVFDVDQTHASSQDVLSAWEKSKRVPKKAVSADEVPQFGQGLPRAMPALQRAQTLSARAAALGFDWGSPSEVLPKLDEELAELRHALDKGDLDEARTELGDLIFAAVNVARKHGWDTEKLTEQAAEKFRHRFENVLTMREKNPSSHWDDLWQIAKSNTRTPQRP